MRAETRVVPPLAAQDARQATTQTFAPDEAVLHATRIVKAGTIEPERDTSRPGPSHILGQRYVVLRLVGRGGMGSVYCAYDNLVKREVAVKILHLRGPQAQTKLIEEARVMARLSHPHIVPVYQVLAGDGDEGKVVLVMPYVQGETLEEWLKAQRSPVEVVGMFCQAARGLLAAHRAGIVHRDFKPANVLIAEDGRALVADFGVAGAASDTDAADAYGRIVGTPWYMAPEQHTGASVDPRVDQFAFCLSLWEALAQKHIFSDIGTTEDLITRKHQPLPPWPRSGEVDAKIVNAIYRGLSIRPEDRFPSMAELISELEIVERTSRSWLVPIAASAVIAVAAFGWTSHVERTQQCTGARAQLQGVWDAPIRARVRASILAVEAPYAASTADHVEGALDAFANAWVESRRSACEASTVRGEQPPEVMDLRMACLHRAKAELGAVSELFASADPHVVEHAPRVMMTLPALARCEDIEALEAEVPPPADPDVAARVEWTRALLAQSRVQQQAGKLPEARAIIDRAKALGTSGYLPLQAELAYLEGEQLDMLGHYSAAEQELKRAMELALASGSARVASSATAVLAFIVGERLNRVDEGLRLAHTAVHLSLSVDDGGLSQAVARNSLANVLYQRGNYEAAEREHRRAMQLREDALGSEHRDVASSRLNLGVILLMQARHEEAEDQFRQALASWMNLYGPQHPYVAACRNNLGMVLYHQGRHKEAEAELREALELRVLTIGSSHPWTADTRNNLGNALFELGRHAEAEAQHRSALASQVETLGENHVKTADSRTNLAIALTEQGRLDEAEAQLRQAVELRLEILGPDHPAVASGRESLGAVLLEQGRLETAEAELRTAVILGQGALGPSHPDVGASRKLLGDVLYARGHYDEARREYELSLETLANGSRPEHQALALGGLGRTLAALGRYDEAGEYLERAWSIGMDIGQPRARGSIAFDLAKHCWRSAFERVRAVELAQRAQREYEAAGPARTKQLREVEQWLAERRALASPAP